jgi:heme A synthase
MRELRQEEFCIQQFNSMVGDPDGRTVYNSLLCDLEQFAPPLQLDSICKGQVETISKTLSKHPAHGMLSRIAAIVFIIIVIIPVIHAERMNRSELQVRATGPVSILLVNGS